MGVIRRCPRRQEILQIEMIEEEIGRDGMLWIMEPGIVGFCGVRSGFFRWWFDLVGKQLQTGDLTCFLFDVFCSQGSFKIFQDLKFQERSLNASSFHFLWNLNVFFPLNGSSFNIILSSVFSFFCPFQAQLHLALAVVFQHPSSQSGDLPLFRLRLLWPGGSGDLSTVPARQPGPRL